jgi:Flp pilus assembly protein TadD
MNDLATAERYFAAAARLAPASASARNNYGAVLLRRNRTREAAEEFTASLRLDPRGANALLNLAQIKFAAGSADDLRAARDLFADANALAPNPDIARALVVISLRLNEKPLAVAHYRDYARLLSQASTPATGSSRRIPRRTRFGFA